MSRPRTLRTAGVRARRPSKPAAAATAAWPINLTKPDLTALAETRYNKKSKRTEISNGHNALGCLQGDLEATGVCHALKDEGFFIRGSHVSRRGCRGGLSRNRVRGRPR